MKTRILLCSILIITCMAFAACGNGKDKNNTDADMGEDPAVMDSGIVNDVMDGAKNIKDNVVNGAKDMVGVR